MVLASLLLALGCGHSQKCRKNVRKGGNPDM
jgi:hypothetical protein